MYLCDCYFYPKKTSSKFSDLIDLYSSSLLKNGNIYGDYIIAWFHDSVRISFLIPSKNSLSKKYLSEYTRNCLEELNTYCSRSPRFNIVRNQEYGRSILDISKEDCLYLFTHFLEKSSPVSSGKTGNPVPLYVLPVSDIVKERLYFWMQEYKSLDRIYICSGDLELPAYKQLANPQSGLSKEGRVLCLDIEKAIKKPVFYYLHRYWGRKDKDRENERPCPGCGGKWRREQSNNSIRDGIFWFDFKCQSCRLVSHEATSFDNEKRAQIGEYIIIKNKKIK